MNKPKSLPLPGTSFKCSCSVAGYTVIKVGPAYKMLPSSATVDDFKEAPLISAREVVALLTKPLTLNSNLAVLI